MPWLHEREHYRVAYPSPLRPKFMVQGFTFDVVDVCERGIRFDLGNADPPDPGFEVVGTIRFRRGETVAVRAPPSGSSNGRWRCGWTTGCRSG